MTTSPPAPDASNSAGLEHAVFHGMTPRRAQFETACEAPASGIRKSLWSTLPFLMTGTLAAGVGVVPGTTGLNPVTPSDEPGAHHRADSRPGLAQRLATAALPLVHAMLTTVRPDLPATYSVQSGDSVSSIASRFGMPTPAILTLNGLSWNSVVHEGQILKLSAEPTKKRASSPPRIAPGGYVVEPGETVSTIAQRLGISTVALLAHNDLDPSSVIYAGQLLRVPGASVPTLERLVPAEMPVVSAAPGIVLASSAPTPPSDSDATSDDDGDSLGPAPFDAADTPLAERPVLITVQVPQKPAAPAPKTPAPKAPAPVAQASAPAPAPAPSPAPTSSVGQPVTGSITPLNDERRTNAQIIINVGRELGVPDYGIVIALATAMQESSLRNINWGDRDSLGLYQQRPSTGWGTAEQIMDPAYSTRLFFGGPQNPNRGRTRGLLDIAGWQTMALTDAAQRVQISAYPLAYAKWEPSAWAWLYELS